MVYLFPTHRSRLRGKLPAVGRISTLLIAIPLLATVAFLASCDTFHTVHQLLERFIAS